MNISSLKSTVHLVAVIGLSLTSLTACSSAKEVFDTSAGQKNAGPCPEAFALYETSRSVEFRGAESYANVGYTAEIENVRSLCRYIGEQPIEADIKMEIAFGRGPAAVGQTTTYEYYVAVTRKNIDVINKQIFPISITFPALSLGCHIYLCPQTFSGQMDQTSRRIAG